MNPHGITKDFETELCRYTGAPLAVAVNSCTMALLLAVKWHLDRDENITSGLMDEYVPWVEIPKLSYLSVPMSIIHAGGSPVFRDEDWIGEYQLKPLPVWDSARLFTSGMYKGKVDLVEDFGGEVRDRSGQMMCVSFHTSKILGDTQGGAILHDNPEADEWFRRMRFDGRTEGVKPKDDDIREIGFHCYLSPDVAARLLWKMSIIKPNNDPLPNDDYKDLSTIDWENIR